MSKDYSTAAFTFWMLVPPVVAAFLVASKSAYTLVYGGVFATAIVLVAGLVCGWVTKTLGASLFGIAVGLLLVFFGISAML